MGGGVRFGQIDRGEAAEAAPSWTPTTPPYEPRVGMVAVVYNTSPTLRAIDPIAGPPRYP
jgi:hypothetical protein